MAVVSVIEHKRDSARKLKQDGEYLVPTSEYTRHFQVVVDDPATAHSDIYAHASIPALFTPHPEYDGVICKSIVPVQGDDEQSYVYEVTVQYDDEYNGADPDENEGIENPLDRPTVIRGGFSEYEQIMVRDVNGVLIRNKAKDFFDPPVTRKGGALRFSMSKNFPTLNLALLKQYKNAINSDIWFGQAVGTVRIANITFERMVESVEVSDGVFVKLVYWPTTFDFELAEDSIGDGTWRKYVQNKGFRQLVGGLLVPIFEEGSAGDKVSEPAFLTTAGVYEPNPDNVNYLAFDVYRSLPFSVLGLL